jgi:hypothetical protein
VGYLQVLLELSKTVENKGSSANCLIECGNESQCPVALILTQFQKAPRHKVYGAAGSRDVRFLQAKKIWFEAI